MDWQPFTPSVYNNNGNNNKRVDWLEERWREPSQASLIPLFLYIPLYNIWFVLIYTQLLGAKAIPILGFHQCYFIKLYAA